MYKKGRKPDVFKKKNDGLLLTRRFSHRYSNYYQTNYLLDNPRVNQPLLLAVAMA